MAWRMLGIALALSSALCCVIDVPMSVPQFKVNHCGNLRPSAQGHPPSTMSVGPKTFLPAPGVQLVECCAVGVGPGPPCGRGAASERMCIPAWKILLFKNLWLGGARSAPAAAAACAAARHGAGSGSGGRRLLIVATQGLLQVLPDFVKVRATGEQARHGVWSAAVGVVSTDLHGPHALSKLEDANELSPVCSELELAGWL